MKKRSFLWWGFASFFLLPVLLIGGRLAVLGRLGAFLSMPDSPVSGDPLLRGLWKEYTYSFCKIFGKPHLDEKILQEAVDKRRKETQIRLMEEGKGDPKIPLVIHTVYTTYPGCQEVDPLCIKRFIKDLKALPKEVRSIFWSNDFSRIPNTVERLKAAVEAEGMALEFREFTTLGKNFVSKPLYDHARKHRFWNEADQLLAMNILYVHGGLYGCPGVRFQPNLVKLCRLFESVLTTDETQGEISCAFFASAAGNPMLRNLLIELPSRINELESGVRISLRGPKQEIELFSKKGLMAFFLMDCVNSKGRALGIVDTYTNGKFIRRAGINTRSAWVRQEKGEFLPSYPLPPSIFSLHNSLFTKPIVYNEADPYFQFDPVLFAKYSSLKGVTTEADWLALPRGVTDQPRKTPVIVSLTSWPPRLHYTWLAIESIMEQEVKPDRIILHLAEEEFPEHKIPKTLVQLQQRGLEIRFGRNFFGGKKLMPLRKEHEYAVIVTVDDDKWYTSDWLATLLESHEKDPACIWTYKAYAPMVQGKKLLSVKTWIFPETLFYSFTNWRCITKLPYNLLLWMNLKMDKFPSLPLLLFGAHGVLYPPRSLHPSVWDEDAYLRLSAKNDDVWFYAMALLNRTVIKMHPLPKIRTIELKKTEECGLFENGNSVGLTDRDLQSVFTQYGLYDFLGLETPKAAMQ